MVRCGSKDTVVEVLERLVEDPDRNILDHGTHVVLMLDTGGRVAIVVLVDVGAVREAAGKGANARTAMLEFPADHAAHLHIAGSGGGSIGRDNTASIERTERENEQDRLLCNLGLADDSTTDRTDIAHLHVVISGGGGGVGSGTGSIAGRGGEIGLGGLATWCDEVEDAGERSGRLRNDFRLLAANDAAIDPSARFHFTHGQGDLTWPPWTLARWLRRCWRREW